MDLTTITDITQLEALAYQQAKALQMAQMNLQLLEKRIDELQKTPAASADVEEPKTKK